jgi:farnesyl-diphosphate farnesyltransferase
MGTGQPELLTALLRDVSRSFYLTLRVLPSTIRRQIGLAYLLARASDTIADTDAVSKDQRLNVLAAFRDRICSGRGPFPPLDSLAGCQSSAAERLLLERLNDALASLDEFSAPDQERIRQVLGTIISGQMLDVGRFANAGSSRIIALESDAELDDYTYRVAGCVGEFWTRMCRAHAFPGANLDDSFLLHNGVRFGKGLQLVNILRDLPADLKLGRCYLPSPALQSVGLEPADLFAPSNEPRLRPVYKRYLNIAQEHLEAGWAYTNYLPMRHVRIRLACAWPILIGVQTLAKLRTGPVLDSTRRVKVSRSEVRQLMLGSLLAYPWPGRWRRLAGQFGGSGGNTLPPQASLAK